MATEPSSELLFVAQEKIYPREIKGRFQTLRTWSVYILLGLYYILPWLQYDDRQAVLFDMPARKFYIFMFTFWPQDFYYLTWLMVIAAITLFLSTAIAGRLWCGYACPQTVWTEAFIWMERWAEGDRNKQIKLDDSPWNWNKIWRKSFKQLMWVSFACWTGFTFVAYFTPVNILAGKLIDFSLGPWELFWIIFYSAATYGNAGFLREQVCKYMCPYARFQSAMFDKDTLIISYDPKRGEPRGNRRKDSDYKQAGLGDCIDCKQCVQVCPTGIDIRDGLQYECIACGACIDACDSVMEKMGYPKNLIRYTTQHAIEKKKTKVVRVRTIIYSIIWFALIAGFIAAVLLRTPLDVDVIRDRNALYQWVDGTTVENVYTLKIMNKDFEQHRYKVSVSGLPGLHIDNPDRIAVVDTGEVYDFTVHVRAGYQENIKMSSEIRFEVSSLDTAHVKSETSRFIMPPEPRYR